MNFSERYKKDNEKIVPDDKFLVDLVAKLKDENTLSDKKSMDINNKRRSFLHNKKTIWIVGVAAACLFLLISYLAMGSTEVLFNKKSGKNKPLKLHGNKIEKNTQDTEKSDELFKNSCWYNEGATPTEIYKVFLKRLEDENDLQKIYKSNVNIFKDENIVNKEDVSMLIQNISMGKEYANNVQATGEVVFYMCEFNNGDIIKFSILNNQYLKIKDINIFYKLN